MVDTSSVVPEPTPDELRSYQSGRLPLERFEVVDRWLASLDPDAQTRVLELHIEARTDDRNEDLLIPSLGTKKAYFIGEGNRVRYQRTGRIGSGGMGIVDAVHDQVLDRNLALKRCRPRDPSESLAGYAVRLRSFRREAAITAQLEHPAIVPIHDIGVGPYGEPAFVMKRIEGESLTQVISLQRRGSQPDLADLIQTILRVTEAVAFAHGRSIVHRDIKPENVVVGTLGAVYVLDWGLATVTGVHETTASVTTSSSGLTQFAVGTPAWMAPEQMTGAPADVRMDVFALGGLLMAALTGVGPRPPCTGNHPQHLVAVDLSALKGPRVPQGLAAVARRCLSLDPSLRYADAGAVATDLRRWLSAGVTFAEHPTVMRVLFTRLRRSPRVIAALAMAIAAVFLATLWALQHQHMHHDEVHTRLERVLARVAMDDLGSIRDGLHEVHDLAGLGAAQSEVRAAETRLTAALESLEMRASQEAFRQRLMRLSSAYRIRGPWGSEIVDLREALRSIGLTLLPDQWQSDAEIVRRSVMHDHVLVALVQLERAIIMAGGDRPIRGSIPHVIEAATDDPAWRSVARLLERSVLAIHDLKLPIGPDAEQALNAPVTADLLLETYGPEERLVRYADSRLATDAGAFWPRVIAARAALQGGKPIEAERHALVALGAEPYSVWPHLLLGYAALGKSDPVTVVHESEAGLSITPDNLELLILRAAGLASNGHLAEAQTIIDNSQAAGHLQYHLLHPAGHPMERSVHVLVDSGIHIPEAEPQLGPIVNPTH